MTQQKSLVHSRLLHWWLVWSVLNLSGCAVRLADSQKGSSLSSTPATTLVSAADFRHYLAAHWRMAAEQKPLIESVASQTQQSFWSELEKGVEVVHLRFGERVIYFDVNTHKASPSQASIKLSQKTPAARQSAVIMGNVLRAEGIEIYALTTEEISSAYFTLLLLLSGDESLVGSLSTQQLALLNPVTTVDEWIKLARLGQKAYHSDLAGAAAALDPETWRLLDKNRKILGFAVSVSEKAKWSDPRMQTMNRMLKQMLKASDVLNRLGTTQERYQEFIPDGAP